MHSFDLKRRIFLPLIVAGCVVFFIGANFVEHLEQHHRHDAVSQLAGAMQSHIRSALEDKAEMMVANLNFIVRNPAIIAALKKGDRQQLLALAAPIYQRLHRESHITHFYFDDAHRVNLLRVHKPGRYGDTINRFTALGAERTGHVFSGIELGPLGTFTLRCVMPVFDQGKRIGYIELGQEIDQVLADAHRMFHAEMFLLIDKKFLKRKAWEEGMRMLGHTPDWGMLRHAVVVSQSMTPAPAPALNKIASAQQQSTIQVGQDIEMGKHHYWAGIIPMQDAGGRTVGRLVVLRDMTDLIDVANHELWVFTGISAGMSLLILVLFYLVLDKAEKELAEARQRQIDEHAAREKMQAEFISRLQAEDAKLRESEERFEKISASAQDAIVSMDHNGKVSFWNKSAEKVFGYSEFEAVGANLHEMMIPLRFRDAHLKALPFFLETGQGAVVGKTVELTGLRKDGSEFPVEMSLASTRIAEQWNAIAVMRDITERKNAQREVEQALHIQRVLDTILNISLPPLSLKEVLEISLDAILSIPAFALLNKGAIFLHIPGEQTLELTASRNLPDALLQSCGMLPFGKCLCGRAAATQEMVFVNHLDDRHEIRYDGIAPHGHYCVPIMSAGQLLGVLNLYVEHGHISEENERKYMKTVADTLGAVIERKRSEAQLEQMAHNDALTGLPNRSLFHDRMEQALVSAKRQKQKFAVLFLDLDRFKEVNDSLGHDLGDLVLKQAAERLFGCVRGMDTVARMGGDEFTVILTNTQIPENAEMVANKIIEALSEPFEFGGASQTIGCSIGIAVYPDHGEDSETLLKHADIAMYHAKRERNTFCFFKDGLRDMAGRGPSRQS